MIDDAAGGGGVPSVAVGLFDPTTWHKSSRSEPNGGNCVEVNLAPGGVGLRDSKLAASPVFVYAPGEWSAFLAAVKAGRFDSPIGE